MLEYWWMASNETGRNISDDVAIEEVLQDPGSVVLFVGYPRWLLHFAAACCVLFMLIGIPGNLITVIALFRTKKLKNATAVFIMNLSVSDLMFCCFNLPLATSTFWHSSWLHGSLLCRLFPLLRYGLVAVSLFTVLAITINRYVTIGHPRLYPALYRTRYLIPMILAIWLVAFGVLIVTWFERWGRFGLDPAIGSCSILPDANGRSPKEFLFVIAFLIPCLAIIVCYARIFHIVRRTSSKSKGRGKVANAKLTETSYEQQSTSVRNQEEELSVLCASSSPMRVILLPPNEEIDRGLPSRTSPDKDTSCSKQSDAEATTPITGIRRDPRSSSGYDALRASNPATAAKNIPFVDEPDLAEEVKRPAGKTRNPCESQRRSSRNFYGQPNRMASRASFVAETSLWTREIARPDDHPDRLLAGSRSHSPERPTCAKRAPRRESKFRSAGGTRNSEPAAPRMSAKDRKLLQMILVIFSSFLVCYLPITITKLFRSAVDWRGLNIAGYVLIYLTTCINPVIYVVMSSEYRSAYKYVLLCKRERAAGRRRPPDLLMPS